VVFSEEGRDVKKNLVALALLTWLGGCVSSGPYASTGTTQLVMVDRFHGKMRPCGPDRNVCFEMTRDDADRRAAGSN